MADGTRMMADKRPAEEETEQVAAPAAKQRRTGDMSGGEGGTGDRADPRLRFPNTLLAPPA